MAGTTSDDSILGKSNEEITSGHRSQSGEALAEWRSSEQVENGIPSTSPPYWDTDDDDDGGPKPSDLYGKYTWRIEKFSQLNKRELRSNAFEVGGYKWYILIYPQGCDVSNHLSLFLCVANHDKLLPGWSHFAQFTIAVVNKDPKKSKYSDTLHRFWKKEHDWGWKKFMELSKVLDGFVELDTLIIKAQVQVIREKAEQPFRCLDCQYRRELVRVYLTNVEQICRRFVEERRSKLGKLIEDKARWSSFCAFWLGIDQNSRRRMSREKMHAILKVVVKHFFIEKEVTSTLVMDSLYSGLKAFEGQFTYKKGRAKLLDTEEVPAPIVRIEKDTFVLVDDVLVLLERAAMEPLPPKDEKGPQNRTKDGSSGEDFNKDSVERDERRLTELGRRTVEIFVLSHIFSNKVEVAYQEAVALKRQEELIREEEAAWLAETEQKARRGTDKEKKLKKKQAKQKRNNRKGSGKGRECRAGISEKDKQELENPSDEQESSIVEEVQPVPGKLDILEDVSDASNSLDCISEVLLPDSEDRDTSPVSWDTDTSEAHPSVDASGSGMNSLSFSAQAELSDKKGLSLMDDSSSTCSTDSVPSLVTNGPYKGSGYRIQKPHGRGKNQHDRHIWAIETGSQPSGQGSDAGDQSDVSGSSKPGESESEAVVMSVQDRLNWLEHHMFKKEEDADSLHKKLSAKSQVGTETTLKDKKSAVPSSAQSSQINLPTNVQKKPDYRSSAIMGAASVKQTSLKAVPQTERAPPASASKAEVQKPVSPKPTEKATTQPAPVMSRPLSASIIPGSVPSSPSVSTVQTASPHSHSISTAGRLGPGSSPATRSHPPQSYINVMMGKSASPITPSFSYPNSPYSSGVNPFPIHPQPSPLVSAPSFVPLSSERFYSNTINSGFLPFSTVSQDALQDGPLWMEGSQREAGRNMHYNSPRLVQNLDLLTSTHDGTRVRLATIFPASTSSSQTQDYPHLDIINDLLDDKIVIGKSASSLNRQFSLPEITGLSGNMESLNGSCRFERTRSAQDGGFQRGYSSSFGGYEPVMDFIPSASSHLTYLSGQIDGSMPNQWQVGSDLSYLGMGGSESDGYRYMNPEYLNMACGINGYNVFRP